MATVDYEFDDFLAEVDPAYRDFASKIHEELLQEGYKLKVESKASGFTASYSHPKTKRSLLNFLFRKKGLLVRIYADHFGGYMDFLDRLPEKMENEIAKSTVCKRLVNPEDCNPKCVKGFDFSIRGKRYQKCRYGCFQFAVNNESISVLTDFITNECRERRA